MAALLALLTILPGAFHREMDPPASAAQAFADPAFQRLWTRTDAPVASGTVDRSWYWGPQAGEVRNEPYSGSPTGTRLVQYFDKGRMEINDPKGDRNSQWFVTSGLLVAEMVSGKEQVGDKEYKRLAPAEIAVGGDGLGTDPDAPTYTSFRPLASLTGPGANRAPNRTGQSVTATINRAGSVGDNPGLGLYPGAKLVAYNDVLGHNIPQAFWDFLNQKGEVQLGNNLVEGQQLADWVFLMGYPITEPYWARVKIGSIYADVMFQMFERRTLAYIPSMSKEWQVQMGNVGAHYRRWIYGGPLPSPVVPLAPAANTPNLPPAVDAVALPLTATIGTPIFVSISGFRPGEDIVSWLTAPDATASDAHINLQSTPDGTVSGITVQTTGLAPGQWAITFHGKASNHESVAYFYLYSPAWPTPVGTGTPATSTPTPQSDGSPSAPAGTPTHISGPPGTVTPTPSEPVVPTQPPTGLILSVEPPYGPPDERFTFGASGLMANEPVQAIFTDPNHNIVYPAGSNDGHYQAGPDGHVSITLVPAQAFPAAPTGTWLFELDGLQSNLQGVTGFTLR